jgi:prepilin-type N-terminal cleavage/methylation domain-containing protein
LIDSAIADTSAFLPALIAPLIAGKPNPASNPIIEITTSNSTKVNELLFAFGNWRDEVKLISMTTPTLSPFHQNKNAAHPATAGSANTSKVYHIPAFTSFRNPKFKIQNQKSRSPRRPAAAFTLIELLAAITIIGILAGLTLGAAGAVRRHGATSTAKAEVAALQAACDRYYADYSAYPSNSTVDPSSSYVPTASTYTAAGKVLFTNLVGSATLSNTPTSKRYFEPKPAMVYTNGSPNYFIDAWGYAYGYNSDGTNAPLIWSTAGQTTSGGTNKWITSWPKM